MLMIWSQDPKIKIKASNVYTVVVVMIKTLHSLLHMELYFSFKCTESPLPFFFNPCSP